MPGIIKILKSATCRKATLRAAGASLLIKSKTRRRDNNCKHKHHKIWSKIGRLILLNRRSSTVSTRSQMSRSCTFSRKPTGLRIAGLRTSAQEAILTKLTAELQPPVTSGNGVITWIIVTKTSRTQRKERLVKTKGKKCIKGQLRASRPVIPSMAVSILRPILASLTPSKWALEMCRLVANWLQNIKSTAVLITVANKMPETKDREPTKRLVMRDKPPCKSQQSTEACFLLR